MPFNISSLFFADFRDHFTNHGFHWDKESHMVDTISMTQVFEVCMHTRDGCGGPVSLHLSSELTPEVRLRLDQWWANAEPEDPIPDEFTLPIEFNINLPPLDNPPDLLTIWMEVLGRFDNSLLKANVYASDCMETPTDPARRSMTITAQADVPMAELFSLSDEEEDTSGYDNIDYDDVDMSAYPMCQIITEMYDLCTSLEERVEEWCILG